MQLTLPEVALMMRDSGQPALPAQLNNYLTAPPTVTESVANQLPCEAARLDQLNMYVHELCNKVQPLQTEMGKSQSHAG